jgi:hypothetical protein
MDNGYIACPYYLGQHRANGINEIRCEGIVKDSYTKMTFRNHSVFRKYMKDHCYDAKDCNDCFIRQELNRRYGVNDDK